MGPTRGLRQTAMRDSRQPNGRPLMTTAHHTARAYSSTQYTTQQPPSSGRMAPAGPRQATASADDTSNGSDSSEDVEEMCTGAPYDRVRYLAMFWKGQREFADDLEKLTDLFDDFAYDGETYEIPNLTEDKATACVENRLREFKEENAGDNELHIVVYGGHGITRNDGGRVKLILIATDAYTKGVRWNGIRDKVLFKGARDTLLILDCCHAGSAHRDIWLARMDILAACDSEKITPVGEKDEKSFTVLIAETIKDLAEENDEFTLSQLYEELCERREDPTPSYEARPKALKREIVLRDESNAHSDEEDESSSSDDDDVGATERMRQQESQRRNQTENRKRHRGPEQKYRTAHQEEEEDGEEEDEEDDEEAEDDAAEDDDDSAASDRTDDGDEEDDEQYSRSSMRTRPNGTRMGPSAAAANRRLIVASMPQGSSRSGGVPDQDAMVWAVMQQRKCSREEATRITRDAHAARRH